MSKTDWNKIIVEAEEYILLTKSGSNYASFLSKNPEIIIDRIFDSSRKKQISDIRTHGCAPNNKNKQKKGENHAYKKKSSSKQCNNKRTEVCKLLHS